MPSNPGPIWLDGFSTEEIRSYNNRLGNLAIMSSKINSSIGNESFENKVRAYAESTFHFTKIIIEQHKWTKSAVDERQAKMA